MAKTENYDPQQIRTTLEEILQKWFIYVAHMYVCIDLWSNSLWNIMGYHVA